MDNSFILTKTKVIRVPLLTRHAPWPKFRHLKCINSPFTVVLYNKMFALFGMWNVILSNICKCIGIKIWRKEKYLVRIYKLFLFSRYSEQKARNGGCQSLPESTRIHTLLLLYFVKCIYEFNKCIPENESWQIIYL